MTYIAPVCHREDIIVGLVDVGHDFEVFCQLDDHVRSCLSVHDVNIFEIILINLRSEALEFDQCISGLLTQTGQIDALDGIDHSRHRGSCTSKDNYLFKN